MTIILLPNGQEAEFPDEMSTDEIKSVIQKKFPPNNNQMENAPQKNILDNVPEWLMKLLPSMVEGYHNPKEAFSKRTQGLGRGFQDIGEGIKQLGLQGGEKIGLVEPGSSEKYSEQVERDRKQFEESPAGKDYLTQLIRETASSSPLFLAGGSPIAVGKKLLPKMLAGATTMGAAKGAEFVPEDKSRLGNVVSGAALGASIPAVGAIPKGVSKLKEKLIDPLFYKLNPKKTAKIIQSGHDVLESEASNLYRTVEKEAVERNVNNIPLSENLFKEASEFLPNTRSNNKLLERAKTGDYSSIRKLQSDLRHRGELLKGADLSAERDKGEEILDLRNRINEDVGKYFEKLGHNDLNEILLEANKKYKNLKELYYSRPVIANMVKKGLRKVPKNTIEAISEISKPMEKLRETHPELKEEIRLANSHEDAKKLLKSLVLPVGSGAVGAGLVIGGSKLNLLKNLFGNQD